MQRHARAGQDRRLDATYLLPIRSLIAHDEELTHYLRTVSALLPVIVVDGSPDDVFDAVHDEWSTFALHVRPAPDISGANGKVCGVLSGLRLVTTDMVVIADDDVRYDDSSLHAVCEALDDADLVMPQNYFEPHRWHTRWDTARILLNRAIGPDFSGTLAVRRRFIDGGYDPDVLFENLELVRSVARRGGRCSWRPDLYVRRLPPTTQHFLGQRTRQAYDEFARPHRMAVALSVLPVGTAIGAVSGARSLAVLCGATIATAEWARRCDGARDHFPAVCSFAAPLWVLERGLCSWIAVYHRQRGGVRYGDVRLLRATSDDRFRRNRLAVRSRSTVTGSSSGDAVRRCAAQDVGDRFVDLCGGAEERLPHDRRRSLAVQHVDAHGVDGVVVGTDELHRQP